MEQISQAELRQKFDALQRQLDDLRSAVLGSEDDDPEGWKRLVRFLRAFYYAPGNKLTVSEASKAAREAGYDPRGTAGFYSGRNGSLKADGDWRILTDEGRRLFEQHRHLIENGVV